MYKKQLTYFIIICFQYFFNMQHDIAHIMLKQVVASIIVWFCVCKTIIWYIGMQIEKSYLPINRGEQDVKEDIHSIPFYSEKMSA